MRQDVSVVSTLALILLIAGRPWNIYSAESARILAVETIGGRSHWNFMSAVLRALTNSGHHVTAFTPIPDGERDNYTEVDTSEHLPVEEYDMMTTVNAYRNKINVFNFLMELERNDCNKIYENDGLQQIMEAGLIDGNKRAFDLIIVEPYALDCTSHLAVVLDLPVIYLIPSPMLTHAERVFTGHVSNPSYVAHLLAGHAVPKTFAQRFTNTVMLFHGMFTTSCYGHALKVVDPKPYRHTSPAVSASVIFQNSHYVTETSGRPVTPNLIDVGGVHLKPPKAIPKDLLDFIEDSSHGVIYLSFGSRMRLNDLPDNIKKSFKAALSRVPQRVLWKYEGEMENKPNNVMTQKWFPQRDILLHPKVRLFISHGGMSGIYETIDAGVPILGFPLFYDQSRNIGHLVDQKMALSMDLLMVTEHALLNAINNLINNDTYMRNAKQISNLFKDRPMSPEQLVVYWTEYVIRHKGAPHLKSHALNLSWYQYFLLDVIAVMLISILFIVVIAYKLVCVILMFMKILTCKYKVTI